MDKTEARIFFDIRVVPRSNKPGVEKIQEKEYRVRVRAVPEKGRANLEVVRLMSDYLGIPPSRLCLVRGFASRRKTIEILPASE